MKLTLLLILLALFRPASTHPHVAATATAFALPKSRTESQHRHEAEYGAFLDQLHREDELFESSGQESYNRIPYQVQESIPRRLLLHGDESSGTTSRKLPCRSVQRTAP